MQIRKNGTKEKRDEKQESSVSPEERRLLDDAANNLDNEEEDELKKAIPDNVDEDGEPLNENISYKDLSASDLDIPDDFEDDEDEELGKIPKDEN